MTKAYRAQLRWASVTDATKEEEEARQHSLYQSGR
jgi:hypothetical protein